MSTLRPHNPAQKARPGRTAAVVALCLTLLALVPAHPVAKAESKPGALAELADQGLFRLEPAYFTVLAGYQQKGYQDAVGEAVRVPASAYSATSPGGVSVGAAGGRTGVLLWPDTKPDSWVEWPVTVPRDGLYVLEIDYYPMPGKRGAIQRDIMIDGAYPSFEAKRILFNRPWATDEAVKFDNQGNQMRPKDTEAPAWLTASVEDADGAFAEPMRFYLTKGIHNLRMNMSREPMAISEIRVLGYRRPAAYAEVTKEYAAKGYRDFTGQPTAQFQAENITLKNDPTIRAEIDTDPLASPQAGMNQRFNTFGGWRWRKGNQSATWEFTVPEDGLYNMTFKTAMRWGRGMPAHRKIEIDGRVPFAELSEYPFRFNQDWRMEPLGPAGAEPFKFYLTKGTHRITMTAKLGPTRQVVVGLDQAARAMGAIVQQIVMYTGSNPDPNQDYLLEKNIPGLVEHLGTVADTLQAQIDFMTDYAGSKPPEAATLETVTDQIRSMIKRPDTIANRLEQFSANINTVSSLAVKLKEQPVQFDYFRLGKPGQTWERARANALEKLVATVRTLVGSFFKNYSSVGNVFGKDLPKGAVVLDVWVGRSREDASIIKEMIDEEFTPRTNIFVNVNQVSGMQNLILASTAHRSPDVVLGAEKKIPVEFAIRNAAVNLSSFKDFGTVAGRFRPGSLTPVRYNGSVFGLPEDQNFTMLYYRKDILTKLGLQPPDTWQDVYTLLPTLQEHGMEFYYNSGFTPFLFQHGGNFYSEDHTRSALDSDKALAAFAEWTSLYNSYKLPVTADFFSRFRDGRIPVGVADYSMFVRLATQAPELWGLWEMAPMPGLRRPDGVVDRSIGGSSQFAMILQQSQHRDEAWDLLKWWTDADTQVRFGVEREAYLGPEARWNTANVEALRRLPWATRDIEAIMKQWDWFQEAPVVLGGYATDRWVTNSWNSVVLSGARPREALEDAVREINIELGKKQEEFSFQRGPAKP